MAQARRDQNKVPTLLGVSSVDGETPVEIWADPVTHRLLVDLGSGITTFLGLTDTPSSYTGQALKTVRVNAGETALEFSSAGAGDMVLADIQTNTGAKTFNSGTLIYAGSTSGTTTLNASAVAGTTTLVLPAANDTLVARDTTDTLTNKTLTTPVISQILNTGTLTLPTSTDTLVGRATTDTLTNKTFDANGTGNSITNIETGDIASGSKTGNDTKLVTGTAGTSGNLAEWNADGDLVDSTHSINQDLNTTSDVTFADLTYTTAIGGESTLGNLGATETIDWATNTQFTGTLDSNITFTFSNLTTGQKIVLALAYDGVAQRTITWPTIKWEGGTAPSAPSATGEVLVATLQRIGTTTYGSGAVFS